MCVCVQILWLSHCLFTRPLPPPHLHSLTRPPPPLILLTLPPFPHSRLSFASHLSSPSPPFKRSPPLPSWPPPSFFLLFRLRLPPPSPFFFFSPGHPAGLALVLDSSRRLLTWGPECAQMNTHPHTHLWMLQKVSADQKNSCLKP